MSTDRRQTVPSALEDAGPEPRILMVGTFSRLECEGISFAVRRGGERARFARTLEEARLALSQEPLHCVFLDLSMPGAEELIASLRADPRQFRVPVVGIVALPSDRAYRAAHAMGVDDVVVRSSEGSFTRRAAALWDFDPRVTQPEPKARIAIVHPSAGRRAVLGRFLRQAGFLVSYSDTVEALMKERTAGEPPSVVVVHQGPAQPDASRLVAKARLAVGQRDVPVVVMRRAHAVDGDWGAAFEGMGVVDESAPPDVMGFIVHELLHERMRELRASPRLSYGAMCGFRVAGEAHMDFGLTFNVARDGLFVRTLDAPPVGTEMWLELRPPGRAQVVHLRGRIAWRSSLDRPSGAPAGFGIQLMPKACPPKDLELYRDACDQLRAESEERWRQALSPGESLD